ncbi:ABC transporter ATP-binding protein [Rhizobiaceae bacterium n13]|uniref:ABC transporter ATP-binding protein n=1 Tax=Ferirhizobium litorale TaxID=2927786 RepID=A0AAE3U3P1_9HYPH|nr:ABC transporter ATP-binding protein [Fererhizobium litorale]MDI7862124.1 ABC transporter ATP-binding protein [Fererhizobium litorale]MDI7922603.1 ABC transporter ATP-binding protein [Fererhizobium litorale]
MSAATGAATSISADAVSPVLEMKGLSVCYSGLVPAVAGVDFKVNPGEVVGVIGESGSGKSTLAHAVLGLLPKSANVTGERFVLDGHDMLTAGRDDYAALRGPAAAMVFQNPMTAFSPLHTLGRQLTDLLWRDRHQSAAEKRERIIAVLSQVGLPDPASKLDAYPFQFSGGMLQRVAIAAALLMRPSLLIADEPTTALDVTMEAQILHLMRELRKTSGVAILMISHHLGVIAEICDRVAVMYAGRVVEEGTVREIFANPRHPYTRALFACEPALIESGVSRLPVILGEVPRPGGCGCSFAGRCSLVEERCHCDSPPWVGVADRAEPHFSRCHRSAP